MWLLCDYWQSVHYQQQTCHGYKMPVIVHFRSPFIYLLFSDNQVQKTIRAEILLLLTFLLFEGILYPPHLFL